MSLHTPSGSLQPKSRIALLVFCSILAAALLISNLTELYEIIWRKLDVGVFRALNNTVTPDGMLTQFWAMTNSKTFDRLTFVLMLGICIYVVATTDRKERLSATARIGAITFLILIALLISKKVVGDFHHPSPGYVITPFNNINDYITGYTVKTAADNSFPGDHAMTSALFAGGMLILFRRPYVAFFSILLMVFVSVPRLAGGGHWFTDVIVGGGAACLILLPWLYVLPLVDWAEKGVNWGWSKTPAFMQKWAGRP
jgi:membrane-associated phospholipid phosphatase